MAACITSACFGQRRSRTTIQKIIQLTEPKTTGSISFQEALSKLRIVNRFTGQPLDRASLSQLAWAGLGNRITPDMTQVTLPPLQSPLPTQLFITTNEGVFFYQPGNNSLEQIVEGDVRATLATSTAMPDSVASAGCVIVIASSVTRNTAARRGAAATDNTRAAMLLEAGHIAQNIQLQAVCLGDNFGSIAISDFDSRAVARVCGLSRDLDVLYMVCVGYLTDQEKKGAGNSSSPAVSKKAAIIVPGADFEDKEFFDTFNTLTSASIQTVVASNRTGPIRGTNGGMFDARVLANQIRVDDFDGIIIIGGAGARALINDPVVLSIVNEAFNKRKIIGATSLGTAVLANAGILKSGVKVTAPLSESTNITALGGIFTGELVERDSRIITCIGPAGAVKFAREITDAILGK
jgi:protease I